MLRLVFLSLLLATACDPASYERQSAYQVDQSIRRVIEYLEWEHRRGAFDLLPESPEARPNKHWLATDNQLAVYALQAANQEAFASQLERALNRWGATRHGIIEALAGEHIIWPPYPETQYGVGPHRWQRTRMQPNVCSMPADSPEKVVCQETRDAQKPPFADWQEYADLGFYGALSACNQGDAGQADERYRQALALFDGVGFADKAYAGSEQKLYTTYKVALALYVGARLGEPADAKLLTALLAKQNAAGGFTTLYDSHGIGRGDSNTETTAYALLALATIQNRHAHQVHNSVCLPN
jgi:hypothetical protein